MRPELMDPATRTELETLSSETKSTLRLDTE